MEEEEEHEGEVGDSRAEEEGGRGMEGELSSSRGGGRRRRARVDAGSREDKKDQKVEKVSFSPISSLRSSDISLISFDFGATQVVD